METRPAPDDAEVGLFAFTVFSQLQGAVTAGMIHLGDRLGLYTALAEADGPVSPAELAERTGLHPRWVEEWAHNQGAAHILDIGDDERVALSPAGIAVLADPDSPAYGVGSFHHLPESMAALDRLPESFRTGLGHDYDTGGPDVAEGIARGFEPWYRAHLVADVVPLLDGVADRLAGGGQALDLGCGAGGALMLLAEAFPAGRFRGYDISAHALEAAERRRAAADAANVSFHDPRVDPLPTDGSVDLALTLDCLHDMTDPRGAAAAVRAALADDGTWLIVDIKARSSYAENVARNPMAALMYGTSVLSCLSSALSEPGGEGLGTLGLTPEVAREITEQAGFTRFRKLPVDHAVNAFYEVRP